MKDEDYNPTSHTLTILMVLAVCLAVILSLLASCRTIHDTERVYTHDTLYVNHSDTVRDIKVLHVHDTTRQVEQHYITINQAGDTIREIHHYHDTERTIIVDSTDRYEAKTDSLQRLLDREREKEKVVEKKPTFLEFMKVTGTGFLIAVGVILFIRWRVNKESNDKR
jgi:hypothetical protein